MSCLAAGLTIDPSSLPKVDTIADKLQRKKEQEAENGHQLCWTFLICNMNPIKIATAGMMTTTLSGCKNYISMSPSSSLKSIALYTLVFQQARRVNITELG